MIGDSDSVDDNADAMILFMIVILMIMNDVNDDASDDYDYYGHNYL